MLLHVHLSGELGATLDCTFAEAPCVGFFDRLVLGGSTEDAFGFVGAPRPREGSSGTVQQLEDLKISG